jgi:hypothetical protein
MTQPEDRNERMLRELERRINELHAMTPPSWAGLTSHDAWLFIAGALVGALLTRAFGP